MRHYDEVGLVTPSARSTGGFRLYTDADVARLLVIRRMKPLAFTLEEMAALLAALDLLSDPGASSADTEAAQDVVRTCHAQAEESCARLRRHLTWAEELTARLAVLPGATATQA